MFKTEKKNRSNREEPQKNEKNEADGPRPAFSGTRAGVNPRRCWAGNSFSGVEHRTLQNMVGLVEDFISALDTASKLSKGDKRISRPKK
jgi:hypothetical protein